MSHLKPEVCCYCSKVMRPAIHTTAGWLCRKCELSATRREEILTIGGVTFRRILKDVPKKKAAPARAAL
jgi:hypothetical protein